MKETPQQRRTRLIEQYLLARVSDNEPEYFVMNNYLSARKFADAVIAATPPLEPAPTKTLDIKSLNYDGTPATRYPSEIESRLIELCKQTESCGAMWRTWLDEFAAIKRDLGLD